MVSEDRSVMPGTGASPHIDVIICTRNRAQDLQRCLASLLAVVYPHWSVLVVDQSDDQRTEQIVNAFMPALGNLAFVRVREKGLSRARNAGMAATAGEIIAFLDDDCTVKADWLEQIAAAYQRHPHAAVVFGSLQAAAHDERSSFIPSYTVEVERTLQGHRALVDPGGFGGSMYLRRPVAERIGPFDVHLGAGARFASNEDRDYSLRSILLGYSVVEVPHVVVRHYGARDYQSGAVVRMLRDCLYSQGALHMKLLRAGHLAALWMIAVYGWRNLMVIDLRNLLLLRRPNRVRHVLNYACGLLASFQLGVDRRSCLYKSESGHVVGAVTASADTLVALGTVTDK
jgi:glycosyltransferase involved in cell wall biosynthesis